jgi:hypothetical protein
LVSVGCTTVVVGGLTVVFDSHAARLAIASTAAIKIDIFMLPPVDG